MNPKDSAIAKAALTVQTTWTLSLNKYQRDNLLWLINACGIPTPLKPIFDGANTGDWIGEIAYMLSDNGMLGPDDHPNVSLADLAKSKLPMPMPMPMLCYNRDPDGHPESECHNYHNNWVKQR